MCCTLFQSQRNLVESLKNECEVLHSSQVHFWRKAAISHAVAMNVPVPDIEKIGWTADKVMNKNYNKEPPPKFILGQARCPFPPPPT